MTRERGRSFVQLAVPLFAGVHERATLAFLAMIGLALSEGAGLLLLLPVLHRAQLVGGTIPYPPALGFLARLLPTALAPLLVLFVLAMAARAGLEVAEASLAADVETRITNGLRTRCYDALAHARWEVLAAQRGARIAQVLTVELGHVGGAASVLLRGTLDLVLSAMYIGGALLLSPRLSAVALACGLALTVLLRPATGAAHADGERLDELGEQLFVGATEDIAALKNAKAADLADEATMRFSAHATAYGAVWGRAVRRGQQVHALLIAGSAMALAVIVYLAVTRVGVAGATLVALLLVYARLVPRVAGLHGSWLLARRYLPAVDRVTGFIEQLEAHREEEVAQQPLSPLPSGSIVLRDIRYRYPGAEEDVLRGVSFAIPRGELTAIVGPSGAGKSTLADVVLMLLAPSAGELRIGEVVIDSAHRSAWRRAASYVAQDTHLRNVSLRENVRWMTPGASDERIVESLGRAGAAPLLSRLPAGLDTTLGDRGTRLSAGERQRVSIARALLSAPELLVLDESLAALDIASEAALRDTLATLAPTMTVVLITHRWSTLREDDHVVVIEDGRVSAEGRCGELRRAGALGPPPGERAPAEPAS